MFIPQALFEQFSDQLRENAPLGKQSWFRVGGNAAFLFKPKSEAMLAEFCKACSDSIDIIPLGASSNVIIRDGGIDGVVIKLTGPFTKIEIEGNILTVGAGVLDQTFSKMAAKYSLTGFEFLIGVPGMIGGALRMNAGAYGQEIKDVLIDLRAVHKRTGEISIFTCEEMEYSYRHSNLSDDYIFTFARFEGIQANQTAITACMDKIIKERNQTQPTRSRTGGSTFKNPPGDKSAWQLIDEAGLRGFSDGRAMISNLHCNFMINQGGATAANLEHLGEKVREKIMANSGIMLEWEIKHLGKKQ